MEDRHLDEADRHIVQAEQNILHQKAMIARLMNAGHDTTKAENLLVVFTKVLKNMQAHREQILKELDRIRHGKLE